jgi:hypothetical protein
MKVLALMENLLVKCFADKVLVAEVLVYGSIFVSVGHVLIVLVYGRIVGKVLKYW